MTNISPSLYEHVRSTLLRCGPFDSSANLGALFVDARISPWRYALPDAAPNRLGRVETVINALSEQFTASGENALVLLLHVLRDRTSLSDACYRQLDTLADALARELTTTIDKREPVPGCLPEDYGDHIKSFSEVQNSSTEKLDSTIPPQHNARFGSFRERKRQLVQQRLDALMEEFEAANRQLMQSLAEVDRLRLRRTMASLEAQISETETELAAIGQEGQMGKR